MAAARTEGGEGVEEDGSTVARTCGQAPEVDGMTIVEGTPPAGTFVDVRITEARTNSLRGEVVQVAGD